MRTTQIKLLIVFAVAFSLSSLPGPLFSHFNLPSIPLANAATAPNPKWLPAGPSMDTVVSHIFSDEVAEFNAIGAPTPNIDTTDWPLTANLVDPTNPSSFVNNPNLLVTNQVTIHGYYELEFMLDNNYWGIDMNFGNNPNGIQLRQGISHLINKNTFVTQQGDVKGLADAVDSPVPFGSSFTSGGTKFTFTTPNSCLWDGNFTGSGAVCTQSGGPPGGVAYSCAATGVTVSCPTGTPTGTVNYPWQPQIGSPDFCSAAAHFITAFRHAGIGTLTENSNCILQPPTGQTIFPVSITSNPVDFFVRLDHHPRFELGTSIAQEVCGLWTGVLASGCNFPGTSTPAVSVHTGTISSFCGFTTSTTGVNPCWWIYTAGFSSVFPIDSSIFFGYNSRFVSGVCTSATNCITANSSFGSPGPCSISSVPTPAAGDYIYLCNSKYDTDSSNVEFASSVANAFGAGTAAADDFGRAAYSVPVWTDINQNAYLNNWSNVLNADGAGTFPTTQFVWLNDYSANPAVAGQLRQGFKQSTRSLSPYIGTTVWDAAILDNIYDTPLVENPLNTGQLIDWMTTSHSVLPSSQLGYPRCALPPAAPVEPCYPGSAVANLRLNLRNDLFFQDGRQVTGFDVKFAYVTLLANGAFFGSTLAPVSCARSSTGTTLFNCTDGVTVKSKNVVDIHLDSFGPFTTINVGTTIVFPGRYWSANCANSVWDTDAAQGNVPDSCMTLDPSKAGFSYDPIANGILVGSGPWECADVAGGTGLVGFGCSSSRNENPPIDGTYTLTRYGTGQLPGSAAVGEYSRSIGTLASYVWTGVIGDTAQDTITGSAISGCTSGSTIIQPLGSTGGCGHWQQGIGQINGGPGSVTQTQVNIFQRFDFLNWVAPQTWAAPPCSSPGVCRGATTPPDFMAQIAGSQTAFYEGVYTLYASASLRNGVAVGCNTAYNPTSSTSSGGFDC